MKKNNLFNFLMAAIMMFAVSCDDEEVPAADQSVDAEISAFSVTSPFEATGTIDQTARTITIQAPEGADITAVTVDVDVPEGATVAPASGASVDFTEPVEFTVAGKNADGTALTKMYTVTVNQPVTVEPAAVAFVGNAATIDGLEDDDAKAAALWTQETYGEDFVYIPAASITEQGLSGVKVIFYYELKAEEPSEAGMLPDLGAMANESVATAISNFVKNGGQLLLAGDAAQYIFDIDRVPTSGYAFTEVVVPGVETKDPSDIWGISVVEGTTTADRTGHPLFADVLNVQNKVELNNSTEREVALVWWSGGPESSGGACCGEEAMVTNFEEHLKATKLGSLYHIGDYFGFAAVEFGRTDMETAEAFSDNIPTDFTGHVLMLGNTIIGYEWVPNDESENAFQGNIEALTKNAIDYLLGLYDATNQ